MDFISKLDQLEYYIAKLEYFDSEKGDPFELLETITYIYGNEIPSILECAEFAYNYSGTIERQLNVIKNLLADYALKIKSLDKYDEYRKYI